MARTKSPLSAAEMKSRLQAGMQRLHAAEQRSLDARRLGDSTYAGNISVNDLAETISQLLAEQKAELVGHMTRLFQLSLSKANAVDHDVRFKNLHSRICQLESELRVLTKRGSR
jgi:hypothetical protein